MHPPAAEPGEIGVPLLVEALGGLQGSVSEAALELRDISGAKTSDGFGKTQTDFMFHESMAASFVAVLTAPTPESGGVLFYPDDHLLVKATGRVMDLIRLAESDEEDALAALRESSKGMHREFRNLVKTVMRTEGGISVDEAMPGLRVEQARITPKQAAKLEALISLEKDPVELEPFEASLVGMNVESKNFTLRFKGGVPGLGSETKLSGTLDPTHADELLERLPSLVVGAQMRYWATVSIIPSDFSPDGAPFVKPKLVWLEMIEDDPA